MRLFAFLAADGPAVGLLTEDDRVVRISAADGGLDLALAEGRYDDVADEALARAAEPGVARDALQPLPALEFPGKVVGVGLNYRDHIAEHHLEMPEQPTLFAKFGNAIVGDGEPIVRPEGTAALDLEVELAVVIGRRARRVSPASAMDHVAGYLAVNDVTARDWQGTKPALAPGQRGDGQWLRAKGSDTFFPIGPVFVSADEIPDPHALRLRSWRIPGSVADPDADADARATAAAGARGAEPDPRAILMQNGTTADMVWRIPELIEYISRQITLEPGDIISTGTPSGVGVFRDPPVFLQPGDRVRCDVERIGWVENPVVDWTAAREDD